MTHQSIPSLTIPGDSHILVTPGVGFLLLCLAWGSGPRTTMDLNSKKMFDNFEKKLYFCFVSFKKQMSSSSFHMFLYARSEQCDLGPIYTITNTQPIGIYPSKLKSILVKFHLIQDVNIGKHAKESQTVFTFLTTENLSGLPCSHECKCGAYSDLPSYAVNLPG